MPILQLANVLAHLVLISHVTICSTSSGQYKVYHTVPKSESQLNFFSKLYLQASKYGLDFWQPPGTIDHEVHVMVKPDYQLSFVELMREQNLDFKIAIPDVAKLIEEKELGNNTVNYKGRRRQFDSVIGSRFNVAKYNSYNDISQYMYQLQQENPQWVQIIPIGFSHEGRQILMAKIGRPSSQRKPAIWIDGGIHAREWISPSTAVYFIHWLATGYGLDTSLRRLVDELDFYIVPVINVDGYEYSRSDPRDLSKRLWRKNRSPVRCTAGSNQGWLSFLGVGGGAGRGPSCCSGVDLNRNFDFEWGTTGSSSDPCEEIYQGTSPFSEPESRAVRDFILPRRNDFAAFITLHSYSQIWMYPYGHRKRSYPVDVLDLRNLALNAKNALRRLYGTQYQVGTGADTLYPASGGSEDWAKSKAGIKYVYLLELRPADNVNDGFILGEHEILPTGKETWEGIKVVATAIMNQNRAASGSGVVNPQTVVSPNNQLCVDQKTQCAWWAQFGACQTWPSMRVECRRSCNTCPFPTNNNINNNCQDFRTDCNFLRGQCVLEGIRNQCRRTCGQCSLS